MSGLDRHRRRIAELMLQAEAERAMLGHLVEEYATITGPFDRFYSRAVHFTRTRPLITTLLLSLGGFAAMAVARRLPYLPLRGISRGTMIAASALRSIRRYRQSQAES